MALEPRAVRVKWYYPTEWDWMVAGLTTIFYVDYHPELVSSFVLVDGTGLIVQYCFSRFHVLCTGKATPPTPSTCTGAC